MAEATDTLGERARAARLRDLGFPRRMTMGAALERSANANPSEVGWVFEDEPITFGSMLQQADRLAGALIAHGFEPGDRVAIWLPNKVEWALSLFACARIGAVLVAINTRWKATEAAYVISHSQPRILILQRRFLKIDFQNVLEEAEEHHPGALSSLEKFVSIGDESVAGGTPWDDFLVGAEDHEDAIAPLAARQQPTDNVLLQYTSGSTAQPKGALVPHLQMLNYGVEQLLRCGLAPGEAYLNTQPLYHVGGSCAALPAPLTLGCRVVTPEYYEAERVLKLIEREGCVVRSGTPTMYFDEMNHPRFADYDTSSLRAGWTGAAASITEEIRGRYPLEGLVNLYGATEGGGTCGAVDEPWEVRRDSVGKPYAGTEFKIASTEDGAPVPIGEVGEICFRGWNRMSGYFDDEERTAEAIDAEDFFHSGDLGHFDQAGYLHYVGRVKDMIRPGGENVAAEEVESFLVEHPSIQQAAVIGAPDRRMGEVVVAILEPAAGASPTEAEVIDFCQGRLANFRVPKAVYFVSEWPLTSTGKIHKPTLRERFGKEVEVAR